MSEINVERAGEGQFRVRVREGESETAHEVALTTEDFLRLGVSCRSPEELLERSFRFLLEREPKESILPRFHIDEISRYFPEFESEIAG